MLELVAGALLALGLYAGVIEPRRLVVRRIDVPLPTWPEGWPPLLIAVLADLHGAWPHVTAKRIGGIVDLVVRDRPDLILLPGDFVSSGTLGVVKLPIEATARALAPLAAAAPTYAVLGNHDHHIDVRRVV